MIIARDKVDNDDVRTFRSLFLSFPRSFDRDRCLSFLDPLSFDLDLPLSFLFSLTLSGDLDLCLFLSF